MLYDDILTIDLPVGATTVAYADDLALLIVARTSEELQSTINTALSSILLGFEKLSLQIAPEKTEVILLSGRRKVEIPQVNVLGSYIEPSQVVKYLGVKLDQHRSYNAHVAYVAQKASKICAQLTRILPNVGGPSSQKRKLLATVITSTITYGVEIWATAFHKQKTRQILEGCQRRMALRTISAYRTVSTEAALVLSGSIPLHLLAQERCRIYRGEPSHEARLRTLQNWQQEWSITANAGWTRTLITKIDAWLDRKHGELDYFLTQFLTGHGCFGTYLTRFRIKEDHNCLYCGATDSPHHTIFACERWTEIRTQCFSQTGPLTSRNIIRKMIESKDTWCRIHKFIGDVIARKARDMRDQVRQADGNYTSADDEQGQPNPEQTYSQDQETTDR